jgi:CRISPR-associated endonuclease/helicase Cas3
MGSIQVPKDTLLAKSPKAAKKGNNRLKSGCDLVAHTIHVVQATKTILDTIEHDIQRFFRLTDEQSPRLRATTLAAAFCHDFGKANDGFQRMVRKKGQQSIRHEHLSVLVISLPEVRSWLSKNPAVDYEVVRLLVLGHHLKAVSSSFALRNPRFTEFCKQLDRNDSVIVLSENPDFKKLLQVAHRLIPLLDEPIFSIPKSWSFSSSLEGENIYEHRKRILREFGQLQDALSRETEEAQARRNLLMASRAVVLAADAVASGLRRVDLPQKCWIVEGLTKGKNAADIEKILEKRKQEVTEREIAKGKKDFVFKYQKFQEEAATLGRRALVLAPCGSGKTIAAYLWIQKQLEIHPGWKAIFLYPTTGTATEGFKDYASHDEDAALLHSRSEFDLNGMFKNPDEGRSSNDYLAEKRLFALGYWHDAIFSATADAFLGFMQNNYSSLCLLPILTRSVIVIDEIHSFDYAMFSALLEFLQQFDIPVLLMTASLQKERLHRLKKACPGLAIYPQDEDMKRLEDLRKSADTERYQIQVLQNTQDAKDKPYPEDLLNIARQAYQEGYKVLWVVNTVDRCIKIARLLSDQKAFCYHSRFMYTDRVDRHRDVVKHFQDSHVGGAIAVTTQVCEMSLDLNAAILITELAPASSLIQRMGRCNRTQSPRSPKEFGRVYIYEPVDPLPYQENIQSGNEMLEKLNLNYPIKQLELASALEQINVKKEREKGILFTMPTWEAYSPSDFRDIEDHTVAAVLESKKEEFLRLNKKGESTAGIVLQAPRKYTKEPSGGIWLPIVPDKTESQKYHYCKNYGLREV